jgi:hypothetical protein
MCNWNDQAETRAERVPLEQKTDRTKVKRSENKERGTQILILPAVNTAIVSQRAAELKRKSNAGRTRQL